MSRTFYRLCAVAVYATLLFLGYLAGEGNVRAAEARVICPRPPYMMTTQDCSRVPTVAKPYCPFPN